MKLKYIIKSIFICFLFLGLTSCEEDDSSDSNSGDDTYVFWSDFNGPPIKVWVDDVYQGKVTSVLTDSPNCNSSGNVTFQTSNSSHSFYAEEEDGTHYWSGTLVNTDGDNCFKYLLEL